MNFWILSLGWILSWMDSLLDGFSLGWMDGFSLGWMDGFSFGWMDGWILFWMDGWMDSLLDGWILSWMDSFWMDSRTFRYLSLSLSLGNFLS